MKIQIVMKIQTLISRTLFSFCAHASVTLTLVFFALISLACSANTNATNNADSSNSSSSNIANDSAQQANSKRETLTSESSNSEADKPTVANNDAAKLAAASISNAEEAYDAGLEAFRAGEDAKAIALFQRALEINPDFGDAYLKLGATFAVSGDDEAANKAYEQAAKAYRKATEKDAKNARAFYGLGQAYDKLGEEEDALKAFQRAAKIDAKDAEIQYELGLAYNKLARYKEAVAALTQATNIDPENFRARDALDKAKASNERQQTSLKYLEQLKERQQSAPSKKSTDASNKKATNKSIEVNVNQNKSH